MDGYQVIRNSDDGKWKLLQKEDYYYFEDADGQLVKTPRGRELATSYLALADRILQDLASNGPEDMSVSSVLPWHYTMLDFFSRMSHPKLEEILTESFLTKRDWTYHVSTRNKAWKELFSCEEERLPQIRSWLAKATHMQLTAVSCIGNAYHSINLAFILAVLMEHYQGEKRNEKFKELIDFIDDCDDLEYYADMEDLATFELYYGLHQAEDGNIINLPLVHEGEQEDEICNLIGRPITEKELIGRNYYHYTGGLVDDDCDRSGLLNGIELDLEDLSEDEEEDNWDLSYCTGDDCWIKRINAMSEDGAEYYLIALTVENGIITEQTVVHEIHQPMMCGMFYIPNCDEDNVSYENLDEDDYPDLVMDEIERLFHHSYLNQSLIGKRLPQSMIDKGGNGNSHTEYTYAIQSAFRSAYMHMSVTTTQDGIITDLECSTYASSGNGWTDMFSRPQLVSDREDEAIDLLLYIYDRYYPEEK